SFGDNSYQLLVALLDKDLDRWIILTDQELSTRTERFQDFMLFLKVSTTVTGSLSRCWEVVGLGTEVMATVMHSDSKGMYSWWWNSHISPKNSKWLQENLTGTSSLLQKLEIDPCY
ncbi:hypothetical protein Goshw_027320, partial [Gossypium schwendimanii]|nr:hypothetical protein [Gossypium schwendimanii]